MDFSTIYFIHYTTNGHWSYLPWGMRLKPKFRPCAFKNTGISLLYPPPGVNTDRKVSFYRMNFSNPSTEDSPFKVVDLCISQQPRALSAVYYTVSIRSQIQPAGITNCLQGKCQLQCIAYLDGIALFQYIWSLIFSPYSITSYTHSQESVYIMQHLEVN